MSPDLAVEVHGPSEPELGRKVRQYLEPAVRAVWVVDPETRILTRHAPGERASGNVGSGRTTRG